MPSFLSPGAIAIAVAAVACFAALNVANDLGRPQGVRKAGWAVAVLLLVGAAIYVFWTLFVGLTT